MTTAAGRGVARRRVTIPPCCGVPSRDCCVLVLPSRRVRPRRRRRGQRSRSGSRPTSQASRSERRHLFGFRHRDGKVCRQGNSGLNPGGCRHAQADQVSALESGEVQLVVATFSITDERKQKVDSPPPTSSPIRTRSSGAMTGRSPAPSNSMAGSMLGHRDDVGGLHPAELRQGHGSRLEGRRASPMRARPGKW